MKFVFLIVEYVPHQIVMIQEILKNKDNYVLAYSVNEKYNISNCFNERFENYLLDNYSEDEILFNISNFNPKIVVVGGWAFKRYNKIALKLRKNSDIPIVAYSDTQWRGDWSQKINCLISPFHLKKIFSHIWVSGIYQYEYARKLGFKKNKIIFNSLSCDVEKFEKLPLNSEKQIYPKNFVYIGRFAPEKGIDYLMEAWNMIDDKEGWTLTLIGEGELNNKFVSKDVVIKGFMNHKDLLIELNNSGCFILPSTYEPWALVIHEAAAAGLPIVCTEVCGAAPHFVINDFNGFKVKSKSSLALNLAMMQIIKKDTKELVKYSHRSRKLAKSITPEIGVANLMSLIN